MNECLLPPLVYAHSQMVKAFGRPSKQRARGTDLQMLAEAKVEDDTKMLEEEREEKVEAKDEDDAIMLEEDNEEQEVQEEKG